MEKGRSNKRRIDNIYDKKTDNKDINNKNMNNKVKNNKNINKSGAKRRRKKDTIIKALMRNKRFKMFLLLVLFIFISLSIYKSNSTFKVTKYDVVSPFIPNSFSGFKIAQISDLHTKSYGKNNEKLFEKIDAEKPDIVVITGDTISKNTTDYTDAMKFLKKLSSNYPTYFIYGNHERLHALGVGKDVIEDPFITQLGKTDVSILENKTVSILRKGSKINISGLGEDLFFYEHKSKSTRLPVKEFLGEKADVYTILLAHNPLYWDQYIEWGANLTLSGHVHGGVWRLPIVGGIFSPEVGLFPKYQKGVYEDGDNRLIVSTGLGNSGISFRLFNQPELVIITLKSQSIY